MAQNYTIVTDPSGVLLQNLDGVVYQNYDVNYMPVYGKSYKLTNYNQTTIANKFIPYTSSPAIYHYEAYMTFDVNDTMYITDRNFQSVSIQYYLTLDAVNKPGRFVNIGYTFLLGQWPYGLAFDASGILYVTMNNSRYWGSVTRSWILKINVNTLVGTELIVPGITFGHLYGCTFDSLGNFYVADNTNNRIVKITMVDYSNGTASTYANIYSGINQPTDISFDSYDNGYISSVGGTRNIIKCSPDGTSSIFATGSWYPYTLSYNTIDNILYVADFQEVTENGRLLKVVNGKTSIVSNNLGKPVNPYSIAITSKGQLWVTSIPIVFDTQTGLPEIYVMIPNNVVNNYSTDVTGNLSMVSVQFNAAYTYLYASAYNTNEIWRFTNTDISSNTGVVFYNDASVGPSLNGPTSIAINASGNLYVSNNNSNQIIYITTSTNVGQVVGITGYALNTPSSIKFDGFGNLYVANYNANTICKLTFSDSITATSTLFQPLGQEIITPNSLSFNQTYTKLYVSCQASNKILEIDMTSLIATQYNLSGLSLSYPAGLVYDSTSGILYLSNESTNEIYYITNYNYVTKLDIIETTNILAGALDIALDGSSNLYIANSNNTNYPIVNITQNNTALNIYIAFLSAIRFTNTFVPDRDFKNLYFYVLPLMKRLDQNNNLSDLTLSIKSNYTYPPMAIGQDLSGNKFLVTAETDFSLLALIFIPYTYIPSGTYTLQRSNVYFPNQAIQVAFADISATQKSLFICSGNGRFVRVDVDNVSVPNSTSFTSMSITINGLINVYTISYLAVYPVYQSGNYTQYLYIGYVDSGVIYRVDITGTGTTYQANPYFKLPIPQEVRGLSLDDNGYLYFMFGYTNSSLCRVIPNPPPPVPFSPPSSYTIFYKDIQSFFPNPYQTVFCSWDQSLIIYSNNVNNLTKYYIGFPFTGMNSVNTIGPYDDTGYIFDDTGGANTFDLSFNFYIPYVVIDPSNIPLNTRTEVSIHFVIPFNKPAPSDSYRLRCDGLDISDVFCNNCTYNKSAFLAGTFPTGLVYSTATNFLYVALDNDTISRINPLGLVENDFIPSSAGLKGPTSLVLDSKFNMFILNAGSDFISYLTLENNIISVDNSFFTGINTPICLTYDNISNDYLYLLSGIVPNMRLTKILASDGTQSQIIGLPFGSLYNSNGLTICEFNPGFKFLYISDTDQNGQNRIIQVSLSDGLYIPTTLIKGLIYKPFTMTNKNDGYLYIANKTSNNISKVSVQSVLIQQIQAIQPWVSNDISVPAGLCFDGLGNLYVANSGTYPRNSRISKIYIDYYFFTNVVVRSTPCTAQIYDITTKSYVNVNYYQPPGDPTTFPIPIPYPINA